MASKHNATHRLLATGLFDGLNAFSELEVRLSALPTNKERGDAFEIFAEAYFATQKIALARNVWPFEAIPLEQRRSLSLDTGRDMGVDGLYETTDGELRAYQVKFRSRRPALTWDELSTFMGLTDQVSQRVLFTNCDQLPSLMQDRSGFVAIRGSDLDRLTAEDLAAMREWLHSGRVEIQRKQPRPHQDEALANIATGLTTHDRATVVMACGTGKSLVALWAAERHAARTVLVLVPSLALVRQLLHEWLRETACERFSFICVCSDPTVSKGSDELMVHQADLDFPVTTDSAVVRQYLERPFDGTRFVFSTYQSAQVVADGMPTDADGQRRPFDLGVFDEAHKTASRESTRFSFALEDANLPIGKRLFFTATPRHYDVRKKDKEGESTLVYSMDRPEVYGPVVHTLSFAEAARRGIICDYKVVISVVTSAMVDDHLLRHGETLVAGDAVKARQVALQVALQKAVEKYGVSRIFTFHGTVKAAKSFTSADSEGIGQHLSDFANLHVSGEMPTARREEQMKAFREAGKAVMSNARCLTEGVDVPAVDMVAFISPRKSKVDIVQATGRAMRRAPGKEVGYVMVPLFVEQAANESIEDALKRTGFDDLWDLLGAMKEQDDVLVDIIRQMQEDKGRTGGYDDSRFSERVEVLGPSVSLETIRKSITAECLESLGISWDVWFGKLLAFVDYKNHANVNASYQTDDGYFLGSWVKDQRKRKRKNVILMSQEKQLEMLPGWAWNMLDEKWEVGFLELKKYVNKIGNSNVPGLYRADNEYRLGGWVAEQRKKVGGISVERRKRLESLPGWSWNLIESKWEEGFEYLKMYSEKTEDTFVPGSYRTLDGYCLGAWVLEQRKKRDSVLASRKAQLESLPKWTWNVHFENWSIGFTCLIEFVNKNGHSRVPQNFKTPDGFNLGGWVSERRKNKNQNKLDSVKVEQLENLPGWVWNSRDAAWEDGVRRLEEFANREGNCRVSPCFDDGGSCNLREWISTQRRGRDALSIERKSRLEAIPGWAWNQYSDQWENSFGCLKEFSDREGHCNVSKAFKTDKGINLGFWVSNQRKEKDRMIPERKERLEALVGWAWSRDDDK